MSFATIEEIEDLPNHPEVLLIDVRDPPEIKSTGAIPTSINIPRKFCIYKHSQPINRRSKFDVLMEIRWSHCRISVVLVSSFNY